MLQNHFSSSSLCLALPQGYSGGASTHHVWQTHSQRVGVFPTFHLIPSWFLEIHIIICIWRKKLEVQKAHQTFHSGRGQIWTKNCRTQSLCCLPAKSPLRIHYWLSWVLYAASWWLKDRGHGLVLEETFDFPRFLLVLGNEEEKGDECKIQFSL